MDSLKKYRLVYVATPYTKYPYGIEIAFQHASRLSAYMMKEGVQVYSPIAHSHPLAKYGNLDPLDHEIWMPHNDIMLSVCDALCVGMLETWKTSFGLCHEIKEFRMSNRPIYYIDPITLCVTSSPEDHHQQSR
jgi:hypothetical protein